MTWVDRLLGRDGVGRDLPPGLREAADELRAALAPLGPDGDALARFVVTGDPGAEVLARAGARTPEWPEACRSLLTGLLGQRRPLAVARLHRAGDDVRDRWFLLLDAMARYTPFAGALALPRDVRWPQVLVERDGVEAYLPDRTDRLTHDELDRLAQQQGMPPGTVVQAVLAAGQGNPWSARQTLAWADVAGFADVVERHLGLVRPLVTATGDPHRLHVLAVLARLPDTTLGVLVDDLVDLTVGGSAAVARAAEPLVLRCGGAGRESLEAALAAARPPGRRRALVLLRSTAADDAERDRLVGLAAADRAAGVRDLVQVWEGEDREDRAQRDEAGSAARTDEAPLPWAVDLTPAVDRFCAHVARQAIAHVRRTAERDGRNGRGGQPLPTAWLLDHAELVELLRAHLAGEQDRAGRTHHLLRASPYDARLLLLDAELHDVSTVAVVKTLDFFGLLTEDTVWKSLGPALAEPVARLRRANGAPDLLELAAVLTRLGPGPRAVAQLYAAEHQGIGTGWPDRDVMPFVERYAEVVLAQATDTPLPYDQDGSRLFAALGRLPRLPRPVVTALVDVAVGSRTADQVPAQQVLAGEPDVVERAAARLGDSSATSRAAAARWLGRLGGEAAVTAVTAALEKERNEKVTMALLDTLVALGRPIDAYLSPGSLAAEAGRGLRKGLPSSLSWVRWDGLPPLRWTGTDDVLDLPSLQWLVAQAVKARTAEPSAVLRRYAGMTEPADRPALATALLQQWLAEDVRPVDPADAEAEAHQQAVWRHSALQSHPQSYPDDPFLGRTVDEIAAALLPALLRRPAGSATGSKGVLAVVAAFAGPGVARPVEAYLSTWYGTRSAQCKALLGMLAWVDAPDATQLLLQVANRFRTKGVQEEARRLAEQVAAERGWTTDQLADRTVPTGGLDPRGVLDLPYGERVFTATLADDGTLVVRDPDGAPLRALPQPRRDDDAELAAESRAALVTARKQVKAELARQRDRLAAALVTQRSWDAADWAEHVVTHPLVGRLARGLVWVVEPAGPDDGGVPAVPSTVRPLPDGSLTDVDDDEVTLPAGASVRLAHDALLPPGLSQRWQQHLLDYEVVPPFAQLGREVHSPAGLTGTRVDEHAGYVLESFRLRGRLTKAGWTRGPAVDGGWFVTYERRLGDLVAELGFSGSELPETNRPVALQGLQFHRADPAGRSGPTVPLAEVPVVVFSECVSDLRAVAAMGVHDPDFRAGVA